MRANKFDVSSLQSIGKRHNQSILITGNIKNHSVVSYDTCIAILSLNIRW